eukprot:CAMPEP_0115017592 /NCGR_PEP_ID=MMETSP0216-20121206/28223_1 /TAXON_ID=223996 /ORGANISM="Protocruzia adherens, Strain Boccale" /LENGTH=352 /DNA_ID=CAMNT_0002388467 /DNA_START=355 /DNA_END=1413 /DNA_ORIENTATION=+
MSVEDDDFLDWETRDESFPFAKHIIAGSGAGVVEHAGMYPADTIKTHMQSCSSLTFKETCRELYREAGILRFWRGSSVIVLGCIPSHAVYFNFYEMLKRTLGVDKEGFQFKAAALTGVLSTAFHDVVLTPFDVIKQRMQLGGNSCWDCIRTLIRQEGCLAFYRSLPVTWMMNLPFSSILVTVNENMKKHYKPHNRENVVAWYLFCGGVAGAVASILTNPLDVIKTRLQTQNVKSSCKYFQMKQAAMAQTAGGASVSMQGGNNNATDCEYGASKSRAGSTDAHCKHEKVCKIKNEILDHNNIKYRSIHQTVSHIATKEGLMGFWRGTSARAMVFTPSAALSWATYEYLKMLLS